MQAWAKRLERFVAEARMAGTHAHDLDRTHIVALQVRHGLLRARLDAFRKPSPAGEGSWRNFRTAIAHDGSAMERGLDDCIADRRRPLHRGGVTGPPEHTV